ncbi:hypothetical protein [Streptomyces sp. EN23]|uniref:hypothetical protein n=1 Tax=Streptomyces sp. EN23 TaxID=212774 RepID=UPI000851BBCC|nr:hypothetical protein [Streptomyces sp. EN23]
MPSEEIDFEDNVLEFRRAPGTAGPVNAAPELPDAAHDVAASPATVLNAERGIINTGTVHGGQHITTVELSDRFDRGADGGL